MKVTYQEVSLDEVMHYFYKEYENYTSANYFIDTSKGKVVFKVYTSEDEDQEKSAA